MGVVRTDLGIASFADVEGGEMIPLFLEPSDIESPPSVLPKEKLQTHRNEVVGFMTT
jgi:hypothetical protein